MESFFVTTGRKFFGICISLSGVQQLFYSDFNPVFLPASSSTWLPGNILLVYLWSAILIVVGISIIIEKNARTMSMALGGIFLIMFLFCQVPYFAFISPYGNILGAWTRALKELAFAGGAFCIAGSFPDTVTNNNEKSLPARLLESIIPFGRVFFSITMITFGFDHFYYEGFVAPLVPAWIPYPVFWTYFTGAALMGSGLAIIAKIKIREVGILLGLMIFIWFIFLHIPRAIADPFGDSGNEATSVLQSLGFSGVAFVIAYGAYKGNSEKTA